MSDYFSTLESRMSIDVGNIVWRPLSTSCRFNRRWGRLIFHDRVFVILAPAFAPASLSSGSFLMKLVKLNKTALAKKV